MQQFPNTNLLNYWIAMNKINTYNISILLSIIEFTYFPREIHFERTTMLWLFNPPSIKRSQFFKTPHEGNTFRNIIFLVNNCIIPKSMNELKNDWNFLIVYNEKYRTIYHQPYHSYSKRWKMFLENRKRSILTNLIFFFEKIYK